MAILACWAWIPFCWQPLWGKSPSIGVNSSRQQKQQRKRGASQTENDQRGTENAPLFAEVLSHPKSEQEAAEEKREDDHKKLIDRWTVGIAAAVAVFTGLLVIVGWRGVRAAVCTLRAVRDGSKAALLNAQALIASERPWLVVTIEECQDAEGVFIFRAVNKGNTPAELAEGDCWCEKQAWTFTYPIEESRDPFFLPMQTLIVNGDGFEIRRVNPSKIITMQEEMDTNKRLYVYGRILYWDTFTDRTDPKAEPHMTRWIFAWNSPVQRFQRCPGVYAKNT